MNNGVIMGKLIYFDYCALVLFGILLVSTIFRRMTKGRQNKCFLCMLVISILAVVADICAIKLDQSGPGLVVAKYAVHTLYLLLHSMCPALYIVYLVAQADRWHCLRQNKVQHVLIVVPVATVIVALIINLFGPFVFYLDETDTYCRGSAFLLLYISAVFYIALGSTYLCLNKKIFKRRQFVSLMLSFPILMLAAVLQYFFPEYIVEMFANACGLLLISMMVQRPEETIDIATELGKLSAYVTDMKRGFINEKPVEIILINITNFNSLYRMFGYEEMNDLLKRIADQLSAINKKQKTEADLYYLGDGEFRFVIDYRNFDKTEETAQMINNMMKHNFEYNRMELNLHATVCLIKCPEEIDNVESLLAFGNELMSAQFYTGEVLHAGSIFKQEHYDLMKDIDSIIENALANHKFFVYYQPIYSVKEQRFNSAEALLRLIDDKYGFISPDVFIPAAEKSGAIHKVGTFVLEEVCKFISSEEYKKLNIDYIEINLSVVQCMENNLPATVLEILKKYDISSEQVNLEITETAASYSQKMLEKNLNELTAAGIRFSLDDFGTGYSNMRRIASLPFHIVKIDKSFTDALDNPKVEIVLCNTIQMIKALGMQIVVEGIETRKMAERFSELQCEYIQGYYYSKPIPKNDFISFIQNNNE